MSFAPEDNPKMADQIARCRAFMNGDGVMAWIAQDKQVSGGTIMLHDSAPLDAPKMVSLAAGMVLLSEEIITNYGKLCGIERGAFRKAVLMQVLLLRAAKAQEPEESWSRQRNIKDEG